MELGEYDFLKFRSEKGLLFVTIDHSEVNAHSLKIVMEFLRLSRDISRGDEELVIVFDSDGSEISTFISKLETCFNSKSIW